MHTAGWCGDPYTRLPPRQRNGGRTIRKGFQEPTTDTSVRIYSKNKKAVYFVAPIIFSAFIRKICSVNVSRDKFVNIFESFVHIAVSPSNSCLRYRQASGFFAPPFFVHVLMVVDVVSNSVCI